MQIKVKKEVIKEVL